MGTLLALVKWRGFFLLRREAGILAMAVVLGLVGLNVTRGEEGVLQNPLIALDKAESEGLLRLNQDYLTSVEELLPTMTSRADLEGAVAVQKEVERVKTRIKALERSETSVSPEALTAGPPALLELRAKFDERRKASLEKFYGIYYTKWAKQRDELTKEARLDEANQLQAALDQIEIRTKALTTQAGGETKGGEAAMPATDSKRSGRVPPEAVKFDESYYLFVPGNTNLQTAIDWCRDNGGKLVTIESVEEDEFIGQMTNYEPVIIGAEWELNREVYRWMDGKRMEYQNLAASAPSLKDQHYLLKNRTKGGPGGGSWYQMHSEAHWSRGFVCEWD